METFEEGKAPIDVATVDGPCEIYYKTFGDLHCGHPPIVVVHGGPGSGHNYLLAFRKLWERYKLPVVFWDQVGCAKSTHIPEKKGDKTFWTVEFVVQQLECLIAHLQLNSVDRSGYHLLGHSFGGMVSSCFAARRPQGLKRLVLGNAPGSADLHLYGLELCWKELPVETQRAFEEARRTRDWKAQSYKDALSLVVKTNWCRADPLPPELEQTQKHHAEDPTVTESMWGRTPLELVGSLKGWNCYAELHKINVPTLLYHGEWDIERYEVIAPYIEHIRDIRKVTIERASHMSHLDNQDCLDRVLELLGSYYLKDC